MHKLIVICAITSGFSFLIAQINLAAISKPVKF